MKRHVAFFVFCLSGTAYAQPISDASVQELADKLSAPSSTRSLRNVAVAPAQIDLAVHFDFASDVLQDASKPLLDKLAAAMNTTALRGARFRVEGHTDAQGGAKYNEELSRRRAVAVFSYLATQGVDRTRLQAFGLGYRELLNASDPLAAENRRVRIRKMN
jgi:OOP family OmpA-OmpF porin